MTPCTFTNITLTIQGTEAPYPVKLDYQDLTASATFDQDIHHPRWVQYLTQLEDPGRPPGEATLAQMGAFLFQGLFQGQIRDLWVRARGDLESGSVAGLRLRLAIQPPAAAVLPWEALYDPERRQAFGIEERITLVRMENTYQFVGGSRPLESQLPLKVLLAMPEDPSGQIESRQETAAIQAIAEQAGVDQIQIDTLSGRFSAVDLRKKMERFQPHVLHLATHGLPTGLLLWRKNKPEITSPAQLRAVLSRIESVKLVFLNACLAGQGNERIPLAAVGPQLLQAGIPAIIAMQFVILDDVAIQFASALYESLVSVACSGVIDQAVAQARSTLFALDANSFGYGTPVLWLNSSDGAIFHLPVSEQPVEIESTAQAVTQESVPLELAVERPLGPDIDALHRWFFSLVEFDSQRMPAEVGFVVNQRRRDMHEFQLLMSQYEQLTSARQESPTIPDMTTPEILENLINRIADKQADIMRLEGFIQELIG